MNHQQIAFRRKVIYLAIMAALLVPLSWLGLPTSRDTPVERDDPFLEVAQRGRVLANLRQKEELAQRSLGAIDASSETMKFFALGFRGLATTLLWNQAHEHKKKENWTALHNVLKQIGRLQPNFVSVWRFQGWNLSYNVSAEWDDYRQRYNWVLQGIAYLHQGQQYNRNQTRLIWDEGWSTAHKIGRSDEHRQFRRLFRDRYQFAETDKEEEEAYRPPPKPGGGEWDPPDNWLCAKVVFGRAINLANEGRAKLEGMAEEIYRSEPAKCQMRYAAAIVEEGTFGDVARAAWRQAGQEWDDYGEHVFIYAHDGVRVRMNDYVRLAKRVDELRAELDKLSAVDESGQTVSGGKIRAAFREERRKKLDPKELAVLSKPAADRNREEMLLADSLEGKLFVRDPDVIAALPESLRAEGQALVDEIDENADRVRRAHDKRHLLNYDFWKLRCEAESSNEAIQARRLLYEAQQAHRKDRASLESIEAYDKAFAKWREVFDKYRLLMQDSELGDQICDEIRHYRNALRSHEASPTSKRKWDKKTFVLKELIDERKPTPPID